MFLLLLPQIASIQMDNDRTEFYYIASRLNIVLSSVRLKKSYSQIQPIQLPSLINSNLYLIMSQSGVPYRGIINAQNPNSSLQNQYVSQTPQRPLHQIVEQNDHLRQTIQKLKRQKQQYYERRVHQINEPRQPNQQITRRLNQNSQKMEELQAIILSQQETIKTYRQKLQDFQDNLQKVMKLDKDIHQRLVNPQPNNTLETNVRNVLVALNGRAPYDKLIKMIQSIKV